MQRKQQHTPLGQRVKGEEQQNPTDLNFRQKAQNFLEVLVRAFILEQHDQLCLEDRLPVKLKPLGELVSLLKLSFSHQVLEAMNGNRFGECLDKDLQATDNKSHKK